MSLQDLADALGNTVSRQALHKYESGTVRPDAAMIDKLIKILNVSLDYLYREQPVEIGVLEFRKLQKLPAKEEMQLVEQIKDYLSRYLQIEEILHIKSTYKNPLADYNVVDNYTDVTKAATDLRKYWKMGADPIAHVIDLLEDNHIKVVKIKTDEAIDGFQTWANGNIPVIGYNENKINKPDRIRFTLLHELSHLLIGDKFVNVSEIQKEKYCNHFAGVMLLPDEALIKELGKHRTNVLQQELGAIKKQYGISMQAILMRIKICGILNDHAVTQLFNLFKHMGWTIDEPYDFKGFETSHRFDQLIYRALAEEQITVSKAASLRGMKMGDYRDTLDFSK
jgi:Zn-dependent peptidase ImmA (M78 family)/DNA-binding XRE family transcriptional regulator